MKVSAVFHNGCWPRKLSRLPIPQCVYVKLMCICSSPTRSRPTTACSAKSTSSWALRTSCGNCQETETCMVRACHTTTSSPKPSLRVLWGVELRRGQQRKCWMDNIKEWTPLPMSELLTRAFCRKGWKMISAESFLMSPRRPNRLRD